MEKQKHGSRKLKSKAKQGHDYSKTLKLESKERKKKVNHFWMLQLSHGHRMSSYAELQC